MRVAARSRQVLCPIDFSEPSRRALRYAAAFAARVGSQLTVLYVNHPLLSTGPAAAGYDQRMPRELRKFFLLPFAHSEDLADQERAVALARRIGPEDLSHAEHHRDIVRRFGRFPHRNRILGRKPTAMEEAAGEVVPW